MRKICETYLSMQVGIQFVQIGNDLGATEYLKELDDDLQDKHDIRVSQAVDQISLF
jgi:hypothetical protein